MEVYYNQTKFGRGLSATEASRILAKYYDIFISKKNIVTLMQKLYQTIRSEHRVSECDEKGVYMHRESAIALGNPSEILHSLVFYNSYLYSIGYSKYKREKLWAMNAEDFRSVIETHGKSMDLRTENLIQCVTNVDLCYMYSSSNLYMSKFFIENMRLKKHVLDDKTHDGYSLFEMGDIDFEYAEKYYSCTGFKEFREKVINGSFHDKSIFTDFLNKNANIKSYQKTEHRKSHRKDHSFSLAEKCEISELLPMDEWKNFCAEERKRQANYWGI